MDRTEYVLIKALALCNPSKTHCISRRILRRTPKIFCEWSVNDMTSSGWEVLSDEAKQILETYKEQYANALFNYCMVSEVRWMLKNTFNKLYLCHSIKKRYYMLKHSIFQRRDTIDGPSRYSFLLGVLDTLMRQVYNLFVRKHTVKSSGQDIKGHAHPYWPVQASCSAHFSYQWNQWLGVPIFL